MLNRNKFVIFETTTNTDNTKGYDPVLYQIFEEWTGQGDGDPTNKSNRKPYGAS